MSDELNELMNCLSPQFPPISNNPTWLSINDEVRKGGINPGLPQLAMNAAKNNDNNNANRARSPSRKPLATTAPSGWVEVATDTPPMRTTTTTTLSEKEEEEEEDGILQQVDRFELLEMIGKGAQGFVYKCRDTTTGETRALKELRGVQTTSPEVRTELAIMKRLDHPNLTRLYEVFTSHSSDLNASRRQRLGMSSREATDSSHSATHAAESSGTEATIDSLGNGGGGGTEEKEEERAESVYLVMDFVDGGSIMKDSDLVGGKTVDPFPLDHCQRVFRQVASALSYLHYRHIVHRDVKPSNILVDRTTGSVKLTDFGVSSFTSKHKSARVLGEDDVVVVGSCGTPAFLSPEALGAAHDSFYNGRPADVYALGTTLYVLIYGCLPFTGGDVAEMTHNIVEAPLRFRPLPIVPSSVKELMTRMLDKDPKKRWTMDRVCNHPWVDVNWKKGVTPEQAAEADVPITAYDIRASIAIPRIVNRVKRVSKGVSSSVFTAITAPVMAPLAAVMSTASGSSSNTTTTSTPMNKMDEEEEEEENDADEDTFKDATSGGGTPSAEDTAARAMNARLPRKMGGSETLSSSTSTSAAPLSPGVGEDGATKGRDGGAGSKPAKRRSDLSDFLDLMKEMCCSGLGR